MSFAFSSFLPPRHDHHHLLFPPLLPANPRPTLLLPVSHSAVRSVGRFIVIARVLSAPLIFSLSLLFLVGGVALAFPARASIVRALTRPVLLILPSPPPSSAPARRLSVRPHLRNRAAPRPPVGQRRPSLEGLYRKPIYSRHHQTQSNELPSSELVGEVSQVGHVQRSERGLSTEE